MERSLKVNLGSYSQPANNQDRYTLMNPAGGTRFQRTTNRTRNDRGGLGINGDYVPQCDFMNPNANGERGPWQLAFGQPLQPRRSTRRSSKAGACGHPTGSSARRFSTKCFPERRSKWLLPPLVPGLPR